MNPGKKKGKEIRIQEMGRGYTEEYRVTLDPGQACSMV
jgi:hypothetical protein